MAVRVLPAGTIGIPLNPTPAPEPPPLEVEDDVPTLHLVGRSEQRLAQALFETEAVDEPYSPDTVRALRLLAMDNLVDIIQLREAVQERDAQVAALTGEVDMWRTRALEEHAQRGVEQTRGRPPRARAGDRAAQRADPQRDPVRRAGLAPQALVPAHRRALIRARLAVGCVAAPAPR